MREECERVARSVALEKAYVHQVYQQISDTADPPSERGHVWPRVKQFLSELEPGALVCDVGCGSGKYLDVNPYVFNIGADRCKRLSQAAREKDNEVLMCDNLSLPFRDDSFDAVLSVAVVHHFATTDRRVEALRELARVLRIGGKLIITVWAMEQRHRKFESQDVLVPWHRAQHLSTPSLELSTTTTTSEEEGPPVYHAYTQSSDSDSTRSQRAQDGGRKRGGKRHKGRSIDPGRPLSNSHSSSSLSSPNETCYSFVRRALQKLAGGKRGSSGRHRPWFLDTWSVCTQDPSCRRPDPDGCEHVTIDDIQSDLQDLPIELRRLDDENDPPVRRETLCSDKTSPSFDSGMGQKSKSLTDILSANQNDLVRSRSSVPCLGTCAPPHDKTDSPGAGNQPPASSGVITSQPKPKLVKQKHSLCEEDMEDEGGDQPTDMRDLVNRLPDFRVSISGGGRRAGGVFKQSSMNEELMSTERQREKERVRQNIQKQASLNEDFLFRRQRTFDSLRDTLFSASTAKRFQILKNGLTNKIKISTTGIEKVAGASFKNGFVRILQGWKGDGQSQTRPPPTPPPRPMDERSNGQGQTAEGERRHSREEGSDSSKDSSLQSDTSVDSEDSFASVIFIPKPDQTSPPITASPTSAGPSPGPTSPKFKYQSPIIKQPSLPTKYPGPTSPSFKPPKQHSLPTSPKFKYQMPPLSPGFLKSIEMHQKLPSPGLLHDPQSDLPLVVETSGTPAPDIVIISEKSSPTEPEPKTEPGTEIQEESKPNNEETDQNIQEKSQDPLPVIISTIKQKTGSGTKAYPIVRRCESMSTPGTSERLTKPLPKLLSLELFNPETDDVDSDSSGVSSPDSISSVISVLTEELSACSQEMQHVKASPSEGHSTSNSNNDVELNFSDQSISSLPNCKSPDVTIAKSPDLTITRSLDIMKSPDSNYYYDRNRLDVKESKKSARSPEYLSSSSESLSKSLGTTHEDAKQKPKVPERISSKSTEILKIKTHNQGNENKAVLKEREQAAENIEREMSPSSLLEAAADVASSLEGAVDAVIQSSPRAQRRVLDTALTMRIVEGSYISQLSSDDELFKKCEKKRPLDWTTVVDEPYPDFEFCRVKNNNDSENVPLLSSFEQDSEGESDGSRKEHFRIESSAPGSSWSLGRSERLHHLESQRRQKYNSKIGHRYDRISQERPVVRVVRENLLVEQQPRITLRQRRNIRSHSLSLYNTEKLPSSWEEECRQHLTQFADSLSEKLLEEIDQYREEKDQKKMFTSSLPAGLELVNDPYLSQLNAELSNLSKLSAELHERNNYLASLSDEDLNKELKNSQKNPFYSGEGDDQISSNPFSSRLPSNPFLSESIDPFMTDCKQISHSDTINQFDDSFVPLEMDSPPHVVQTKVAIPTQVQNIENVESIFGQTGHETEPTSPTWGTNSDTGRVGNFHRKPSIITTDPENESTEYQWTGKKQTNATRGNSTESHDGSDSSKKDILRGIPRDSSRITINSSQNISMESNDPDTSDGSKKDFAIPRDTSRITIASSLGHSLESSDPDGSESSRRETSQKTASSASMGHSLESSDLGEVSERTGSGSDYSRKETSSVSTGPTEDSYSLATDCSKDTRFADRRKMRCDGRSSSEETPRRVQLVRQKAALNEPIEHLMKTDSFETSLNGSTSQESLPSDNGGGSITYHRFYHVFREGELDQLINRYVENLHILSSYYDHANWCVIAEKVQVWTI